MNRMYVYIQSEKNLWTVGFYDPTGLWQADSDHETKLSAGNKVHFLNGGRWDVVGLKIDGRRILTDEQLIDLHNRIRDGKTVLVSTKYRDQFDAAVRKLLKFIGPMNEESNLQPCYADAYYEVKRLLGPEPKEPPKET